MSTGKLIIALLGVLTVLIIIVVILAKLFYGGLSPVTIEYWGLWEPDSVYASVIADYERLHPNVRINYHQQSQIQYRERLQAALAQGNGPDIFRFHNSWVPMFRNDLSPVPGNVYDTATFRSTFYPVAQNDLFYNNNFYGIPLEIDTLALYVNTDLFTQAGVSVPTTWPAEFTDAARKLTVKTGDKIQKAGVGFGNSSNVTHWQDVLAFMLMQNGVDPKKPTGNYAEDAINFYTGFQTQDKLWDETQDESKLAFAKGNLAMFLGYSWDYFDLQTMSKGTTLNFKVVPAPQLSGGNLNYASYWIEGVSNKSKNQTVAWDFLKFISSRDEMAKLYAAESRLRGFGEPYSRMDMAGILQADPIVSVFINQAKTAQSSYLDSLTWDGDTGINSRVAKYYADAINAVLGGRDVTSSLATAAIGVNQVLSLYGLAVPATGQ